MQHFQRQKSTKIWPISNLHCNETFACYGQSITLKTIQKPVSMCTEIVNNLTILHNEIQNSKIVFQRWKNICTRKCYLVKYNSDSAAEVNLYKVCNESCVSFDTYTMICLFNLSLIAYFEGKEDYRRTEQLRNFESHL